LALMDSLSAAVGDKDLGAVLAWKAKLLLWIGRPAAALELLRLPAVRSSPEADLLGGAALCGLGRYAQALPVLARRSAAMPEELECRVWRMEALFRLGRPLEALDEARRAEPLNVFRQDLYFHVVRGLSRAAGDSLGLRLDYNAVRQRAYLLDYLVGRQRRKLERYDDAYIRGSLEAVLRLSRGVRRGNYEISIWLKP
jgi:tetratricopeptide (TPR) repeat protein